MFDGGAANDRRRKSLGEPLEELEARVTTTIVTNTAGLTSALKVAQAGDVIQLAAGTYTPVYISGLKFAGTVTVTSADPNQLAVLQGLNVQSTQNLTFRGLEFAVNPTGGDAQFGITNSQNIAFDQLSVHGSLDGNAQNDAFGMVLRWSTNVSVTNSEFQQLKMALTHTNMTNLTVSNNNFHHLQSDGVRGGGSQQVKITDNFFSDFSPVVGDHPDAIQFWTTNTTRPGTDILVSGNVITRGAGDPMQGLFMRDEVGGLAFQRVTVTNNTVVGAMYHGITVTNGDGVVISGNTVAGLVDQPSWIGALASTNVTLSNNIATKYYINAVTNLAQAGDTTIGTPMDGGKSILQTWAAGHPQVKVHFSTYAGVSSAVEVESLANLTALADAAQAGIEAERIKVVTKNGTAVADKMTADYLHDTAMNGLDGNDILTSAGIGHNTMSGGLGDDTYNVNSGFDVVVENAAGGIDTVSSTLDYTLGANVERLKLAGAAVSGTGNALDNQITGTASNNMLSGLAGNDTIQGLGGDDMLGGGDGADSLNGGTGADTLAGDNGNDYLLGDVGNDSLVGGAGADTLNGGGGDDTMAGGTGQDLFVFRAGDLSMTGDRITDFSKADGDRIDLSLMDADTAKAGDQAFKFIGAGAFTKVAGQLHVTIVNGVPVLSGDLNGDGLADFQLHLPGTSNLQASDFIL